MECEGPSTVPECIRDYSAGAVGAATPALRPVAHMPLALHLNSTLAARADADCALAAAAVAAQPPTDCATALYWRPTNPATTAKLFAFFFLHRGADTCICPQVSANSKRTNRQINEKIPPLFLFIVCSLD